MATDPYPVAPPTDDPEALGFEPRQPMVRWFTPSELARAGAETVISALFGAYADNRELQAVRSALKPYDYSGPDDGRDEDGALWIDYVADLGDGWDSTYAIASLLAAEALTVDGHETRRGRILLLGGDQVYPTAKKEEYQNRFAGPYRAALPYVRETPPHLFALPGNHDWYDGLTSFTRLFCQRRWIGGWSTQQSRSYFALELPGNWWIWGVDIQLNADIDQPQWDYFRKLGRDIPPGATIVLCLAEPVWTGAGTDPAMADYDSLAWFEAHTMTPHGHTMAVGLAGDLHAYARWEHADGRQRFISGGGGAYLYPTHRFPETLRLPTEPGPKPDRQTETFALGTPPREDGSPGKALYPSARTSHGLAVTALTFARTNRAFSSFFGAVYLFLAWLVQSASKSIVDVQPYLEQLRGYVPPKAPLREAIPPIGFGEALSEFFTILAHAPLAFLTVGVVAAGLVAFADGSRLLWKVLLGAGHTMAHLLCLVFLLWGFAVPNKEFLAWATEHGISEKLAGIDGVGHVALLSLELMLAGGLLAGIVWGIYLYVAHLFHRHTNEVFSCQAIPDYKHFLRLRFGPDGDLTIYPIGVDRVPRRWDYQPGVDGGPWFTPAGDPLADRARLIEPPIRVDASTPGPAPSGDGAALGASPVPGGLTDVQPRDA